MDEYEFATTPTFDRLFRETYNPPRMISDQRLTTVDVEEEVSGI